MNHKGEFDADRLSAFITKIGEAEKKSIRNILLFEDQVEALHYQGLGRPVCDEINQRWYDLEVVRCFELKSNEAISLIDKVREMLGIENRAEVQMYENDYDYPVWHHYNIPAWVCYSFMLPEDVSKTPPHIVDLLNNAYGHKQGLTSFNYRLKAAIYSGGLKVQDMGELSMEQITLLISPCAIYLYNAGLFIRSSDLVANTFDIEGGILKLLEKHFHDKVLPQPVQIQKNQLLLEHMFEDKVFL